MSDIYYCFLEKKSRGRSFSALLVGTNLWSLRKFQLIGQEFSYLNESGVKKGSFNIDEGSIVQVLNPSEADDKPFPFSLTSKSNSVVMSANSEEMRSECVKMLSIAKLDPNWTLSAASSIFYKSNTFRCTLYKRARSQHERRASTTADSTSRDSIWGSIVNLKWSKRDFVLKGQILSYFDGSNMKGNFKLSENHKIVSFSTSEADGRPFSFAIISDIESFHLAALDEESRSTCIRYLNLARCNAGWADDAMKVRESEKREKVESMKLQQQEVCHDFINNSIEIDLKAAKDLASQAQTLNLQFSMEVLKMSGSKARFQAAKKVGRMDLARGFAAQVLQQFFRARTVLRRRKVLQEERRILLLHAYARKLQCVFRRRVAKHKVTKLRYDRLQKRRNEKATVIQLLFRIRAAKSQLSQLKAEKLKRHIVAAVTIQKLLRLKKAKIIRNEIISKISNNIILLKNLTISSSNTSYKTQSVKVYVTAMESPPTSADMQAAESAVSKAKSANVISNSSLQVNLNENTQRVSYATGVSLASGFLVLTFVDKSFECLGQCVMDLSQYPQLLDEGRYVDVTLPIDDYLIPALPSQDVIRVLTHVSVHTANVISSITFSCTLMNRAYCTFGYIWKYSERKMLILSNSFKRRYFVLIDGILSYSDDENNILNIKHSIDCDLITSITFEKSQEKNSNLNHSNSKNDIFNVSSEADEFILRISYKLQAGGAGEGFLVVEVGQ